ncbi:maleylacetoacetate isomerase [Pseudomonas sp. RIT-PI-S]|uniref:maleylacetoacetate isomerase n=1 Tax=Pseudomonas sp. RIT-PI-S TaxID=3035295 RepID=UPI0021DAE887|nr:maleylacetoacetate isomerase [Pseudomonas sp. RIT-PI-S]
MILYGYYRSTASYRVRIALGLKGLAWTDKPINLLEGDQRSAAFRQVNPQGRVPVLELASGERLFQSSAILEYLDACYPSPPLLEGTPVQQARARAVASLIGSDIHPLHNAAVLAALRQQGLDESRVGQWIGRWIGEGLAAVEAMIDASEGYCFGARPGLADLYLVPQAYAAERFQVPLDACPKVRAVIAQAKAHPAFSAAHPAKQPDAP